jgi:hypothetical protein
VGVGLWREAIPSRLARSGYGIPRIFQREIHTLEDFCYRLVFTGRNSSQLAP